MSQLAYSFSIEGLERGIALEQHPELGLAVHMGKGRFVPLAEQSPPEFDVVGNDAVLHEGQLVRRDGSRPRGHMGWEIASSQGMRQASSLLIMATGYAGRDRRAMGVCLYEAGTSMGSRPDVLNWVKKSGGGGRRSGRRLHYQKALHELEPGDEIIIAPKKVLPEGLARARVLGNFAGSLMIGEEIQSQGLETSHS